MLVDDDSEGSRICPLPCLTSGYSRKLVSLGEGGFLSPFSSKGGTKGPEKEPEFRKVQGYLEQVALIWAAWFPTPGTVEQRGSPCSLPESISVSSSFPSDYGDIAAPLGAVAEGSVLGD